MKILRMKGRRTCVLYAAAMVLDANPRTLLKELDEAHTERDGFLLSEFHYSIISRGRLPVTCVPHVTSDNFPGKVFSDYTLTALVNYSRGIVAGLLGDLGYHALAYSPEIGYVCPLSGPIKPDPSWGIHEILFVPTAEEYAQYCTDITANQIKGKYEYENQLGAG